MADSVVAVDEWTPVPGYEGLYEAGQGQVRSLDRVDSRGNRIKGRVLRPGVLSSGYHLLVLCRDGVRRPVKAHRVIAEAFHGPCPDGFEVRHLDGDKGNNHPDNLCYGTKSENQSDSIAHGTHKERRKTHCPHGHELAEPNLIPSKLAKGHRDCRACNCARQRVRLMEGRGTAVSEHLRRQLADEAYHDLMAAPSVSWGNLARGG